MQKNNDNKIAWLLKTLPQARQCKGQEKCVTEQCGERPEGEVSRLEHISFLAPTRRHSVLYRPPVEVTGEGVCFALQGFYLLQ